MRNIVLDASVVLGAHLPDERNDAAIRLFKEGQDAVFHVPQIWHVEVGNALLMAVRRNRIPVEELVTALRIIEGVDLAIDTMTGQTAWHETMRLAQKHRLSLYDSAYLELAARLGANLATLDARLAAAAKLEDVALAL